MKETPVLFNQDMNRAILEDRKGQTRRPAKPQPPTTYQDGSSLIQPFVYSGPSLDPAYHHFRTDDRHGHGIRHVVKNPLGSPGDLLYCRETWAHDCPHCDDIKCGNPDHIWYRASEKEPFAESFSGKAKWRPSIHMPKWAARTWLKVTGVGIERVQEISEVDVLLEGVEASSIDKFRPFFHPDDVHALAFAELWDATYSKPMPRNREGKIAFYESYPWEEGNETREHKGKPWYVWGNPYVFKTCFERIER